jgi:hypothetical protein
MLSALARSVRKLLTYGNPKTDRSRAVGYLTAIMHLSPGNISGHETCRGRTRGCFAVCLNSSGHGGIGALFDVAGKLLKTNAVQRARIARTRLFFEEPVTFWRKLVREIECHIKRAERLGLKPAVRLNGTSDIAWESEYHPELHASIFTIFPQVQFYDYTKRADRMFVRLPRNYHLTFSRAETLKSKLDTMQVLHAGKSVAAVFRKTLPATWNGYRVVDGVSHDLRFLDPANVIVGLVAKGKAKRSDSGFVIDNHLAEEPEFDRFQVIA